MKCDRCESEATIHITEIRRGLSHFKHLCEACASRFEPEEGRDGRSDPHPWETDDELEMTGEREHVLVADLATGAVESPGMPSGNQFSPVWSPDGRRLALCHSANLSPSTVLVEPGTRGFRRCTHTTYGEPASWSRDSRRIVLSHIDDGACVAIAEADGDLLYHLDSPEDVGDHHPAWSPIDERIAVVAMRLDVDEDEPERCSVVTTPAEGGARRTLARFEETFLTRLRWSPDAKHLAGHAIPAARKESEDLANEAPAQGLRVMRADVEDALPQRVCPLPISWAWLPRVRGFSDTPVLGVMDLPGRGPRTRHFLYDPRKGRRLDLGKGVDFAGGAVHPGLVSPDGKELAVIAASDSRRVILIEPSSGERRPLDAAGEACWLGWVPNSDDLALLVEDDESIRLDIAAASGARRTVVCFDRREYSGSSCVALSPDGKRAAIELHSQQKKE